MKKIYIIFILLVISLAAGLALYGEEAVKADEGRKNYLVIRKMYYKWDRGPVGSKWYFRKQLYRMLVEMIGRDIRTDSDYTPEFYDDSTHVSKTESGKWLVVHGEISPENMKKINALRKKYGSHSQPGKGLFSVSGRIRKFRLSEYTDRRRVYLYLDDMRLEPAESANLKSSD